MSDPTLFVLENALEWARKERVPMILASTSGETAEKMLNLCDRNEGIRLIVATHEGLFAPKIWRFNPEVRKRLEGAGVPLLNHKTVLWVRCALWFARTLKIKLQSSCQTLMEGLLGVGGWVCFKIARRALKAKLIRPGDLVVTIAGKISGADTALALKITQDPSPKIFLQEIIVRGE